MLITELKSNETIKALIGEKKVFIINCHGCKEVRFPEEEAKEFQKELAAGGNVTGIFTTDYICNDENRELRLDKHQAEIDAADMVLVCSCGVGVQSVAEQLPGKMVCAGCDTYRLPGFQGVTPLEHDCGQCGGAKNGHCEVDPNMQCGWERIIRRLEKIGRLDAIKCPVQIRNYATDDEVSK